MVQKKENASHPGKKKPRIISVWICVCVSADKNGKVVGRDVGGGSVVVTV
jgi:hypothetical protein